MNFQSVAGTCNAHLRCRADRKSRKVHFMGLHAAFFSVMTMEALPRRNEHLSPGLSTHDRGSGSQQLKRLGRPLHGNGESYPGTVLWKSQGSVSSEAVS